MSDLLGRPKKELVEIIDQMKLKLSQVIEAEKKMDLEETDLKGLGFSVLKDDADRYFIVELSFDFNTGKAVVKSKKPLDTGDYDVASYSARKFLVEKILNKDQLNHNKAKA